MEIKKGTLVFVRSFSSWGRVKKEAKDNHFFVEVQGEGQEQYLTVEGLIPFVQNCGGYKTVDEAVRNNITAISAKMFTISEDKFNYLLNPVQ